MRSLSRVSKKIAEGNFQAALPEIKTRDEMKELHDSFAYMQKKLSEYIVNLRETTAAREKIESELRIAREIQMGMIPHLFPPFPNLSEIDLFAVLKPAKEVGGDLYDFFLLGDDCSASPSGTSREKASRLRSSWPSPGPSSVPSPTGRIARRVCLLPE